MADGKAITISGGKHVQELGVNASAGAADAGKLVRLNASGKLDSSLLSVNPDADPVDTHTVTASTNASTGVEGDFAHLDASGLVYVADNTAEADAAQGYLKTVTDISGGNSEYEFQYSGVVEGLTGLTPGEPVYLGTAGGVTQVVPTASGSIMQRLGVAVSETEMLMEICRPIELA